MCTREGQCVFSLAKGQFLLSQRNLGIQQKHLQQQIQTDGTLPAISVEEGFFIRHVLNKRASSDIDLLNQLCSLDLD